MNDQIIDIGDSIVQHGKYNDRVYLMKLSKKDFPDIIDDIDDIALEKGYSKIFAKVPSFAREEFENNGYIKEAHIPRFYNKIEDVYFMGKYFSESRTIDNRIKQINTILDSTILKGYKIDTKDIKIPYEYSCIICDRYHVNQMVNIYKKVFETYPFPIFEPEYIIKTMNENFIYFCIKKNDAIVALSSSEMDVLSQNVEMTDFATLPKYRGYGFALYLLNEMEKDMRKRDIKIAYTISRTTYGINSIFAKMGYEYGGTLLNNTNICGKFESMNVWYKFL